MPETENKQVLNNLSAARWLRLTRGLDGIYYALIGILITSLCYDALRIFSIFRYIYLLPILILVWNTLGIPSDFYLGDNWRNGCFRLKYSAIFLAGLSPFPVWWREFCSSQYFFLNSILFILFFIIYILNLIYVMKLICQFHSYKYLTRMIQFTRLVAIYLTLGPVLAFLGVTVFLFGNQSGDDIFSFLIGIESWRKLFVVVAPLVPLILLMDCILKKLSIDQKKVTVSDRINPTDQELEMRQ